ncbi:MAG: HNH endonuclease [Thermodesulfobacteriota bacterium]
MPTVISDELRWTIINRDCYRCRHCGEKGELFFDGNTLKVVDRYHNSYEIDHIVPRSYGGLTEEDNLVLSCRECNRKKGDSVWEPISMCLIEFADFVEKEAGRERI